MALSERPRVREPNSAPSTLNREGEPAISNRSPQQPFGRRTDLGLRILDRPGSTTATPTREAPPSPTRDRRLTKAVIDGFIRTRKIDEQPKKDKGNRALKTVLGLTAVGIVGVGAYEVYENVPAVHRAVDSAFLDHLRGKSLSIEASTDVFDNTAEKGVISDRNTILISREEYQKIAPPLLNAETPEQINILFPIQFPDGLNGRKIKLQKHGDSIGGGARHKLTPSMDPNTQTEVAEKIDYVFKDSLTIKDGLKDGDMLIAPASGTISSGGTITGKDQYGNPYTIMMGGYLNLEYIKEIPPSRSEKVGPGQYRTIESHVPVEQGEPIGIIRNPSKGILGAGGSGGFGQFQMLTFSTVVAEDGTKQQGAANIIISASPEDKVYALR